MNTDDMIREIRAAIGEDYEVLVDYMAFREAWTVIYRLTFTDTRLDPRPFRSLNFNYPNDLTRGMLDSIILSTVRHVEDYENNIQTATPDSGNSRPTLNRHSYFDSPSEPSETSGGSSIGHAELARAIDRLAQSGNRPTPPPAPTMSNPTGQVTFRDHLQYNTGTETSPWTQLQSNRTDRSDPWSNLRDDTTPDR